ncbi:MAG: arylsulfatase [Planctomycetota bacterium]|nr:arylsulfatase [Planctomycetota bacterium]
MMKFCNLLKCGALVFISINVAAEEPARPNIVLIMSDDMGYSDIGCYGGEIKTPNLDQLAADGLRYTQFYNTARCCPTRACLLTGLYPHQTGVGYMMRDRGVDGYRGDLNRNCVTIAEVLRGAGYNTYVAGKWHVSKMTRPSNDGDKYNWPTQRGFDRFYGTIHGAGSFWDPSTLCRGNKMISPFADEEYQPEDPYYYTDAISDQAARFIQENPPGEPFFMYVAYTAAHWPLHARQRDIARYKGKYDEGYHAIREARLEKMKRLGVVKQDIQLSKAAGQWDAIEDKEWEAANMEVYAAMIDSMDQGIGRIINALKETGQFENTLLCYFQDNGGCAEAAGRSLTPNPRGEKPTLPPLSDDALHYAGSTPKQTRDGWPVRNGRVMPGPADTYIGYGENWANVSNTPFREYKHWTHEGGISTPLIVHWPDGFKDKNKIRNQLCHLIDWMPTCVELSGATYPESFEGEAIQPMEGKSLVPTFTDQPLERGYVFWEHEGNRAVREGRWKLVAKRTRGGLPPDWELYDVEQDRSESKNLIDLQPERVAKMIKAWNDYAERTKVFPSPW